MLYESEQWLQKLYDHLETVGEWTWGYGWQTFLSRKLRRSHGYVNQAVRRRNLQISTLLEMLDTLGYDIIDFLAEVSGTSGQQDPMARLKVRGQQIEPEIPRVVHEVRARLDRLPETPSGKLDRGEQELVDSIAEGRYEDPRLAAVNAERALAELLDTSDPAHLHSAIPLLAEWASAQRRCDEPDGALWALLHCFRWVAATRNHARKGDLLQRLAHSYSDHFGDYAGALQLSERALVEHTLGDHRLGIAKTLVDRGFWLFNLNRHRESLESNQKALQLLPKAERRHRFGSFMNQALSSRALGDYEQMLAQMAQAWAIEPKGLYVAPLRWLEGTVAAEERRFDAAESAFLDCCRLFEANSPVNTALVSLELIHLYLVQGKRPLACHVAKEMARLVWPLRRFPIAEAAVTELVRKATKCEISETVLLHTRQKISRARARRECLTRALIETS